MPLWVISTLYVWPPHIKTTIPDLVPADVKAEISNTTVSLPVPAVDDAVTQFGIEVIVQLLFEVIVT